MIPRHDKSNTKYDILVENTYTIMQKKGLMHWHAFYEIEIVMHGDGINYVNGCAYPLKQGIISFLSPNDFHRIDCISDSILLKKLRFYPESVSSDVYELLHNLDFPIRHQCSEEELCSIYNEFNKLAMSLEESWIGDIHSRCRLDCAVLEIVNYAATDCKTDVPLSEVIHKQAQKEWMHQALIYVDEHLSDMITRNEIAYILHISPAYFSRLFHSIVGMTFENYVLHQRIEKAKRLLQSTDLSIGDIAAECGFNSRTFFNRVFLRLVGSTPSTFRN